LVSEHSIGTHVTSRYSGVPFDPGDDPLTLEISKKLDFDPKEFS
jgi:hypothetical protein